MEREVTVKEFFGLLTERMPDALSIDPKVDIKLTDGELYTLDYDMRAAADILKDTGFNLLVDPLTFAKLSVPEFLGHVIHRGLQRSHPDITFDRVMTLIHIRYLRYYTDRVSEAISLILPDMKDVKVKREDKQDEQNPI